MTFLPPVTGENALSWDGGCADASLRRGFHPARPGENIPHMGPERSIARGLQLSDFTDFSLPDLGISRQRNIS